MKNLKQRYENMKQVETVLKAGLGSVVGMRDEEKKGVSFNEESLS